MEDENSQKMKWTKTAITMSLVISVIVMAGVPLVVAPEPTIPLMVTVQGTATYEDGSYAPHGWTVVLWNLDEDRSAQGEPWNTTTGALSGGWNYTVVGKSDAASSTFHINVSDPAGVYYGENASFMGTQFQTSYINLTVYPVGDGTKPITNVTKPPEFTEPIPSGTLLNWTEEDVTLTFNRTDPAPAAGVKYTNISASEAIANVNVSGTIMMIPQIGTDNLTIDTTAFDVEFNVTISNECNATIYYYSVDKNMTANVEDVKNLAVRIDRSEPLLCNATATPSTVVVNITNMTLCADVTDRYSNIAGDVTVNLTSIGGAWNATMPADSYNYTTPDGLTWIRFCLPDVSVTSDEYLGTHNLTVNVSDTLGHYNDTVSISLNIITGVPATNLTAVWNQTDNTTNVSWDGTPDAEYTVYVATNKSFSSYNTYNVTGLSWIDNSATTSALRLYRVNLTGLTPNPNMTAGKFNLTIYNGWNLISIPLMPSNISVSAVVNEPANGDWIYGSMNFDWTYYLDGWEPTSVLKTIEPEIGYFYNRAGSDFEFTVAGEIPTEVNTTINNGWNLVGYASVAPASVNDTVNDPADNDWIYGSMNFDWTYYLDGWEPTSVLKTFEPGVGYFYKRAGSAFYWTYTDI